MDPAVYEAIASMAWQTLRLDPATTDIDPALLRRHFQRKHGAAAYYGQPVPARSSR